jgi:hypothetical protein
MTKAYKNTAMKSVGPKTPYLQYCQMNSNFLTVPIQLNIDYITLFSYRELQIVAILSPLLVSKSNSKAIAVLL